VRAREVVDLEEVERQMERASDAEVLRRLVVHARETGLFDDMMKLATLVEHFKEREGLT